MNSTFEMTNLTALPPDARFGQFRNPKANWMDMMDEFMEQLRITKEGVVASWNFRKVNFLNNMADLRDPFHMMRKV